MDGIFMFLLMLMVSAIMVYGWGTMFNISLLILHITFLSFAVIELVLAVTLYWISPVYMFVVILICVGLMGYLIREYLVRI